MNQPLHTKSADGTDLVSVAGVLLLAAGAVADENNSPDARQRAKALMMNLLNAAHAGGFKQRDILHTLLQRGERSDRVREMARQACAAVPNVVEIVRSSLALDSSEE